MTNPQDVCKKFVPSENHDNYSQIETENSKSSEEANQLHDSGSDIIFCTKKIRKGCGKSFLYEYGQGERFWTKCGEKLTNPDEIALCPSCEEKLQTTLDLKEKTRKVIDDLWRGQKEHKKHYYIEVMGHKVCFKCEVEKFRNELKQKLLGLP